jgi:hypothetical protein
MLRLEEADPETSQGRKKEEVKSVPHFLLYIPESVLTFTAH